MSTQIKTGSYAVTTVYSMPWVKKTSSTSKTRRKRPEKKIVHQIFEECSKLTDDKYWISILRDCARDKFPRTFSYKNGLLIHRKGNKTKRELVPNSHAEAYSMIISFLRTSAGLMSVADRKNMQKEEEKNFLESINVKDMSWKDIKIDKVKEILIGEFINDIAIQLTMSKEEKKELATTVKKGFMLKYFTSKNIVMNEGKISSIDGLIYNRNSNEYSIDPKLTSKRPGRKVKGLGIERSVKRSKISFTAIWEKYLENLERKKNGKVRNFHVIESSSYSHSGDLYSPEISISPSMSI